VRHLHFDDRRRLKAASPTITQAPARILGTYRLFERVPGCDWKSIPPSYGPRLGTTRTWCVMTLTSPREACADSPQPGSAALPVEKALIRARQVGSTPARVVQISKPIVARSSGGALFRYTRAYSNPDPRHFRERVRASLPVQVSIVTWSHPKARGTVERAARATGARRRRRASRPRIC
jgi:hypothetical protein